MGGGGYGFLLRSEFFFSDNARVRIFILFVAQERALRFIYNDYVLNYEEILEKSKMPSLKVRRLRSIAIETFKIIHKESPIYLH